MLGISKDQVNMEVVKKKVYSMKLLQTPKTGKTLAYWLIGLSIFGFFCLFLPWQQNIEGTGTITALAPQDRPQDVPAIIPGRIKSWRVQEGEFITAGDTILVLDEIKSEYFDPEQLLRLSEQVDAKRDAIEAIQNNIKAIEVRIGALQNGLSLSLEKARNKVLQTRLKVTSDSANYEAEKIQLSTITDQFERSKKLFEQGNLSQNEFQRRGLAFQDRKAKIVDAEAKFLASRQEYLNSLIELNSLKADYMDKIFKAESEKNSYQTYLASSQGDLALTRNKYSNLVIRNNQYYILAPQDGYIIKALRAGLGETVKEGESVVTIQPAEPRKAVELYIRPMDVPLVSKGRQVRLEFDGWPALQFSGWPSVNVGTFGGRVAVIDKTISANGKFRILVSPDENDDPWPEQLQLGSGVFGWVMLDDVPIWFEIWRQFNGFPPSLNQAPDAESKQKTTKAK